MSAVLFSLSLIATAIGAFAIGFGISNRDFSLGDTLIVAGTVAVVGGMVLFGLAAAVRQLRRIADGWAPRPVRRQPVPEGADASGAPRPAPGPRVSYPARPGSDVPGRDGRAPEARAMSAPSAESIEGSFAERPRPHVSGTARGPGEPPMMEEPDVPLAPNRTPSPSIGRPPAGEPAGEAKLTPSDIMSRLSNLAAPPQRPAARQEPPRAEPAAEGPAEQRQRPNMFDALWPAGGRAGRQSQPETIARAPRPDLKPEPKPERPPEPRPDFRMEPKLEPKPQPKPELKPEMKPEPRLDAPMPRERVEPAVNLAPRASLAPPASEPRPIAILKSGVIDGMAYTLYTDGSIEAELPQGTMRFASIDELRAHLEKAERSE